VSHLGEHQEYAAGEEEPDRRGQAVGTWPYQAALSREARFSIAMSTAPPPLALRGRGPVQIGIAARSSGAAKANRAGRSAKAPMGDRWTRPWFDRAATTQCRLAANTVRRKWPKRGGSEPAEPRKRDPQRFASEASVAEGPDQSPEKKTSWGKNQDRCGGVNVENQRTR